MSILYLLIPLAIAIMAVALWFFIWTIRSGQYEDMDGPAYRILMDDDDPMIPGNADRKTETKQDTETSASDDGAGVR